MEVKVTNFGPISRPVHINTTLQRNMDGPSMMGKSSVIDAITFVLLNEDQEGKSLGIDAIHDGAATAEVELTTPAGVFVRRRMKSGAPLKQDGEPAKAALPALGLEGKETLVRTIVAPLVWKTLMDQDRGRPLADMLRDALGDSSALLRAEVDAVMQEQGQLLLPADPMDEAAALVLQREANKQRDFDQGALSNVQAQLGSCAVPATDAFEDADAVSALQQWALVEQWQAAFAAYDKAVEQKNNMVIPPAPSEEELRSVTHGRAALSQAEASLASVDADLSPEIVALTNAKATLAAVPAALILPEWPDEPEAETCPTCQGRWHKPEARAQHEALIKSVKTAQEQIKALNQTFAEQRATATSAVDSADEALKARRSKSTKDRDAVVQEAKKTLLRSSTVVRDRQTKREAALDAQRHMVIPADPGPKPAEPAVSKEFAEARVESVRTRNWQRSRDVVQRRMLSAAVAQGKVTASASEAEAARVSALVGATRAAPARVAKQQALKMGSLGPVALHWGAGPKDQAVSVWINGRPARRASTGELRFADAILRAALRKAAGLEWLPIFVDGGQDWSESWPTIDNMVVLNTVKS